MDKSRVTISKYGVAVNNAKKLTTEQWKTILINIREAIANGIAKRLATSIRIVIGALVLIGLNTFLTHLCMCGLTTTLTV